MAALRLRCRWWRSADGSGNGGARWGDDDFFLRSRIHKIVLFVFFCCVFVWLYSRSTYNTLEDMIEFWRQMVGNLMTHFLSQHS